MTARPSSVQSFLKIQPVHSPGDGHISLLMELRIQLPDQPVGIGSGHFELLSYFFYSHKLVFHVFLLLQIKQ